ncbi:MAG TPA: hypothetical protein DCW68_05890 [Rhodospirillaceae bacterium]|nr:MAG: hypothetical protein A2018_03455 [Alphaproteobacteria bacterium GWF2_58_20]HAU29624.1 hypothetical protein [Rhodospirillaceae bacterium]
MRRISALCLAIPLIFTSTSTVRAETASTWLMHHPVTLWDWGMNALARRTEQAAETLSLQMSAPLIGRTNYVFDENRIDIFLIAGEGTGNAQKTCETLRQDFLGALLKFNDPESLATFSENFMQDSFSHAGYAEKSRPKTIARDLVNITRVHVAIAGTPPEKCSAPLSSWSIPTKK